jgi:uncharacterized protein (DUF58 family)
VTTRASEPARADAMRASHAPEAEEPSALDEAHDAVPRARRVRLPFAPTRRLALVVLCAAPLWLLSGWAWGRWLAVAAVGAVLVAAAVDAALTPGARALAVARDFPDSLGMGDEGRGRYAVRARWPRPVRATLHDRLPPGVARLPDGDDGAGAPGGPIPLVIPADDVETAVAVRVVGRTRGVHALGPVALRVLGPLGLAARTVRWDADDRVTVAPSIALVREVRLLALQHRLRDAGVRRVRRRGTGATFDALREYAPGDDPRRIDWKASARRDALVVREYAAEQGQTVMIAIDAGRLMTQLVAPGRSRFDAALDSAILLADVAAQEGDRVGLVVFDDAVRAFVPPAGGPGAVGRIRDALVDVQPVMLESDYAATFRALAQRHRRRSLVVLFTDVIDARASRALLAHVARGAARHLPLVVALRDDALDAAARPQPGAAPLALYETAAAEELLLAREDALARMRQAGVSVVDTPARSMAAAVVNRYLELKARSAI